MGRKIQRGVKSKTRILVIEDDRALREGLSMNLCFHGYDVITAAEGDAGMEMAFNSRPNLIILDLMMPCCSGLDILDELRKRGEKVPVLILSARNATPDKVEGLGLGADDYMTKPFDLTELIARIDVILRRQRADEKGMPNLSFGDIVIDQSARTVERCGKIIDLSAKEFDLLCLLVRSAGRVLSRETILEKVWGWDYEGTERTVDNFVASLRKKIEKRRGWKYIATVPRVGYKFKKDG